jgi:hypothetical protein
MRLRLPPEQIRSLREALNNAGEKEIGGQIFGEQLAPSEFRAIEFTFQKRPGTFARFIVDIVQAARDAMSFFDRTEHRYTRFNYIGEWHSHPSFAVHPSGTDLSAMRDLVTDSNFRGNFAILMIIRLDGNDLTVGAWLFDPAGKEQSVTLEFEV